MVDLATLVKSFSNLRTIVVGEAMLDCYSVGEGKRLCGEAPVPVVDGCTTTSFAGGAANTAVALRALGAQTRLLSAVGNDWEGMTLLGILRREAIGVEQIVRDGARRTLSKHRIGAGDHLLLRFDHGSTEPLGPHCERSLCRNVEKLSRQADVLVVSDYGYGIVTPKVCETLERVARRRRLIVAVDSKRLHRFSPIGPAIVKPNYAQAVKLLGLETVNGKDRYRQMCDSGAEILRRTGARIAAVTLDVDGAVVLQSDQPPYRTFAEAKPARQAAGAGDTYLAAFSLALAAGATATLAAEIAAAAAGVVVGKIHTSACSNEELIRSMPKQFDSDGDSEFNHRSALDEWSSQATSLHELVERVDAYRAAGKRIVMTNGCFDILHRGHVAYLQHARALGDVLVVGVNTDESIRRIKGPERPINCLEDRLGVLAGLSCIDELIPFGERTPERLVAAVRPDIFVKGGDYTREMMPEAPLVERLGGRIVILPLLVDHSTSRVVQRIRESAATVHSDGPNGSRCYANG
ncbi:MAG TPA: D-glycero-beta-D-manno-heptose 1-phosphate adenylyltransferase [Pirellulales bacterium]|jgi:D-beta-D-heptose 7-phosphate kinase/D-beta-D-heptose 1-phosphate adenosyltransferase|nr:D-glycero-beta-D-manno-heptose 1-phosphate adenylyltransferase [Pirellulales bacterium]